VTRQASPPTVTGGNAGMRCGCKQVVCAPAPSPASSTPGSLHFLGTAALHAVLAPLFPTPSVAAAAASPLPAPPCVCQSNFQFSWVRVRFGWQTQFLPSSLFAGLQRIALSRGSIYKEHGEETWKFDKRFYTAPDDALKVGAGCCGGLWGVKCGPYSPPRALGIVGFWW